MSKALKVFDHVIDKPKAKLNALVKYYITANGSQVFAQPISKTLKGSLALANNDSNTIIELVSDDLMDILKDYFDAIDINIEVINIGDTNVIRMDLRCDGVSYDESIPIDERKAIHNNTYLKLYENYTD